MLDLVSEFGVVVIVVVLIIITTIIIISGFFYTGKNVLPLGSINTVTSLVERCSRTAEVIKCKRNMKESPF